MQKETVLTSKNEAYGTHQNKITMEITTNEAYGCLSL